MLHIHPNARTTPVARAQIARSSEPSSVLARRYSVSTETIRKWCKRAATDCLDRSARPHQMPWKASEEERAVVCALRRVTNFALDDLTLVLRHFLPHLNRDSIWCILRAEGLNRRPKPPSDQPARGQGTFRDYDLSFVHIDIKHLPKLQTGNRDRRKRYLFVAIDRKSRSVHLAVKDDCQRRPDPGSPAFSVLSLRGHASYASDTMAAAAAALPGDDRKLDRPFGSGGLDEFDAEGRHRYTLRVCRLDGGRLNPFRELHSGRGKGGEAKL